VQPHRRLPQQSTASHLSNSTTPNSTVPLLCSNCPWELREQSLSPRLSQNSNLPPVTGPLSPSQVGRCDDGGSVTTPTEGTLRHSPAHPTTVLCRPRCARAISRAIEKNKGSPLGPSTRIRLKSVWNLKSVVMFSLSLSVIILPIYELEGQQRCSRRLFISQTTLIESLLGNDHSGSVTMTKVSWSCVEVACCVPNCETPTFNPQISHMIPKTPLTPQTPISACNPHPPARIGEKASSPCCEKAHKHFLYSIVLPKSTTPSIDAPISKPEIRTPDITMTANSSPTSLDSAPIFTPTSPPERPSLRARRDTLTKLKIPESPPLSQEIIVPVSQPSPSQPASQSNNRSAGTSMYPDMFLPMPSQPGAGNMSVSPLSAMHTVSPMTSAYTPLFSRDVLAMSPISPLMYSNHPSPIMGTA
jgi:hypothetical protein